MGHDTKADDTEVPAPREQKGTVADEVEGEQNEDGAGMDEI